MQRRMTQATGWSVVLHGALFAGVLLIGLHPGEGPSRISIIDAELVFDAGAWSSSTNADTDKDGATAARAIPEAEAPEPTETNDPAKDATVADANEPELTEQTAEAASETVAATEPPPAEPAPQPQPDTPPEVAPHAPSPSENQVAAAADAPTAPESPSGFAGQTREQQKIAKRFESWTGRFTPGKGEPSVDWKQDGQAYKAVFRAPSAADPMGLEHIVVDVSTEQGGKKMSTQLTMTRLAFSNFAQFVDTWDPNVQIHDDVIDGRFHSNTPINLLSSGRTGPLFLGKVTIASHELEADSRMPFNRRKVFPEGVDTGVRRIALPARFLPLLNEAAKGDTAVQRFERDARITFYADGTYGWTYVENGAPEERRPVTGPAHYLVGLEGATLRIKGTVNGKVLVYSAKRIVIEDDLHYADVRGASDADDYLGLVAELDIEIAEPEITGTGDLGVDASIYARRRFAVRDFRSRPSGTLVIYGSVTAGSITATEPRFATKIEFDRRLASARPPSFPLTDRYELESWNGQWRVEEPAIVAAESSAEDSAEDSAKDLARAFAEDFDEAADEPPQR